MILRFVAILILASALVAPAASAQGRHRGEKPGRLPEWKTPSDPLPQQLIERRSARTASQDCMEVFDAFQRGLVGGDVSAFSAYLAPQVYLNLRGAESGYFSANQAYYVLQDYLGARRVRAFQFTTYGDSDSSPYATGPGRIESRGNTDQVQVYVSLSKSGSRWVLGQINIY